MGIFNFVELEAGALRARHAAALPGRAAILALREDWDHFFFVEGGNRG